MTVVPLAPPGCFTSALNCLGQRRHKNLQLHRILPQTILSDALQAFVGQTENNPTLKLTLISRLIALQAQ